MPNGQSDTKYSRAATWALPLVLAFAGGAFADRLAIERSTAQEQTKIESIERTVAQLQADRDRYVTMAQFLEFGKRMDAVASDVREIKQALMERRR